MKVLLIQNCSVEGFGTYADALVERGVTAETVHPWRGELLPLPGEHAAVLVAGMPAAVAEADEHPFMAAEMRFLRSTVRAGRPCLAICAGAQLLAHALGADVHGNRVAEVGGGIVRLTERGSKDPLFAGFPSEFPVFQWHADTFNVPDGGELLAVGGSCRNQAFRHGAAVGLQFHLEITTLEAERWIDAYAAEMADAGKKRAGVLAECRLREAAMAELADRLIANFLEQVA